MIRVEDDDDDDEEEEDDDDNGRNGVVVATSSSLSMYGNGNIVDVITCTIANDNVCFDGYSYGCETGKVVVSDVYRCKVFPRWDISR